jgi:hypothetical protein
MTREESIKVLAILKAAYPNSYRNMSKDEANGTVMVWQTQFANIPPEMVLIAVNKLISTSPFPPAISEVKDKIRSLYWEVWGILEEHRQHHSLSSEQEAMYKRMFAICESMRNEAKNEPSLLEIASGGNQILIGE